MNRARQEKAGWILALAGRIANLSEVIEINDFLLGTMAGGAADCSLERPEIRDGRRRLPGMRLGQKDFVGLCLVWVTHFGLFAELASCFAH